jgi:outer membrane protein TolC
VCARAADVSETARDYRDTPPPLQLFLDQWTLYPPPPSSYTLEFLRTADTATAALTLREAVLIGLENNPGIEVNRLEPYRTAEETRREQAIFDPLLTGEFAKDFLKDPRGTPQTPFSTPVLVTRNRDYNLSIAKLLRSGAQFEMSFLNNRFVSNLPNQVLAPQYRPRLEFSLAQPLLRDFGLGLTTIFIRIAENREGISLFDYQARLMQLIQRITEAYWGVVFARENLAVQKKGVELAQALLTEAEAKARSGVVPPVNVVEAQAEKARREEFVIAAENDLDIARKTLSLTIHLNPQETFLPRPIEPTESPSVRAEPVAQSSSLERAITARSELLASRLTIENQTLQVRYAENQLLPRLDLKASTGLTGIAGDLRPGTVNPFPGDYGRALDRLGSADFYDYSVGVELQIPLGNAQAKSDFARTRIELDQARARHRDLVAQITLEVARAVGDVKTNFERIQSTRLARALAEENLRAQRQRFEVGLVTQTDVIDFQSRVLNAQVAELRAIIDYNNALARLKLAEGTLLEHYHIQVEGPKKEADPWWARF